MNDTRLDEEWQVIAALLPADWQTRARTCGALRRTRRVPDAEVLLRLILLHVAGGLSLRQTAMRARQQGLAQISDVGLLKRLRAAGEWLRYLSQELTGQTWAAVRWPVLPAGYRLRAVDASNVQEPGATGTDWRLHYSLALPSLCCDHFELTDAHGGESLERFPVQAGDLLLADRGYCRSASLVHVQSHGGDYVIRLHSTAVPLWEEGQTRFDLLGAVRSMSGYESAEWPLEFRHQGRLHRARLCALRRSAIATEGERAQVRESARKSGRHASAQTLELAAYILVLTSLPAAQVERQQVLDLYRLRWQIELAFKRLKSLLALGHLPKYDPESARAWLQAKLLTALLMERLLVEAKIFSPWGFPLARGKSLEPVH